MMVAVDFSLTSVHGAGILWSRVAERPDTIAPRFRIVRVLSGGLFPARSSHYPEKILGAAKKYV